MNIRDRLVSSLLLVPYVPGGRGFSGADCWGIVEIWFLRTMGIELCDRGGFEPGPDSLQVWSEASRPWNEIKEPKDDSIVTMRSGRLEAGHVGIVYDNHVMHTSSGQGPTFEPLTSRRISFRITNFLEYAP